MTTSDNGTGWNEHKPINTGTGALPKVSTAPHISEELPNWVCLPDDDYSHLTRYVEDGTGTGFGGCNEHPIAGGCTIPQEGLQALLDRHTQAVLASLESKAIVVSREIKDDRYLWEEIKAIPVEAVREAIQAVRGKK